MLKIILFRHKTKWYYQKFLLTCKPLCISKLCMLIRGNGVKYVETLSNDTKVCNFVTLGIIINNIENVKKKKKKKKKNAIKKLNSLKLTKSMQKNMDQILISASPSKQLSKASLTASLKCTFQSDSKSLIACLNHFWPTSPFYTP